MAFFESSARVVLEKSHFAFSKRYRAPLEKSRASFITIPGKNLKTVFATRASRPRRRARTRRRSLPPTRRFIFSQVF